MAQEIRILSVTVPANTPKTSLNVTTAAFGPRTVERIEVVVPDGPRGEVGFWIGTAGTQVVPHDQGTFVVTNNEVIGWPVQDLWDSGSWQVQAYNTGLFAHTLQFRFLCNYVQPGATGAQPLSADQLGAAGDVGSSLPTLPGLPPPPVLPPPTLPPIPGLGPPASAPLPIASATTINEEDDLMTGPVAFVNPFNGQQHKLQVRDGATGIEHWWQSNTPGSAWNGPEVLPNTAGKVATGAAIYASVYSVPGQLQVWVPLADNSGAYHAWQASGSGTWNNEVE